MPAEVQELMNSPFSFVHDDQSPFRARCKEHNFREGAATRGIALKLAILHNELAHPTDWGELKVIETGVAA